MNYQALHKWQSIKTPTAHQKSFLVFHSDDGNIGDYELFLRMMAKGKEKSSWPTNLFPFNPAINTVGTNSTGKLTTKHLLDIKKSGGEILSHGHMHLGYGSYPLIENTSAGSTSIKTGYSDRMYHSSADFNVFITIEEGAISENVKVINVSGNTLTLATQIVNSYTTSAVVYVSETTVKENLNKVKTFLSVIGIDCKHHVFAWHNSTAASRLWTSEIYDDARGDYGIVYKTDYANRYNLKSRGVSQATTKAEIDVWVNDLKVNEGILFLYAHGSMTELEYLMETSLANGIRFINTSEAITILKKWGVII